MTHGDQAIARGIEGRLDLGYRHYLRKRLATGRMDLIACILEFLGRSRVGEHDRDKIFLRLVEPIPATFVRLDSYGVRPDLEVCACDGWPEP